MRENRTTRINHGNMDDTWGASHTSRNISEVGGLPATSIISTSKDIARIIEQGGNMKPVLAQDVEPCTI
jgi:hypothetical protein